MTRGGGVITIIPEDTTNHVAPMFLDQNPHDTLLLFTL